MHQTMHELSKAVTTKNAVRSGDKNVYFIDGEKLFWENNLEASGGITFERCDLTKQYTESKSS